MKKTYEMDLLIRLKREKRKLAVYKKAVKQELIEIYSQYTQVTADTFANIDMDCIENKYKRLMKEVSKCGK